MHERTVAGAYQALLLWYLVALLFLYPYGLATGGEASFRLPDVLAVLAVLGGIAALLMRGSARVDRTLIGVVGAFVLLELFAPFVGAVGYRRPVDVASSVRMAMLWLPMLCLAMIAPPWRALAFETSLSRIFTVTLWLNLGYAVMQVAATIGALPRAVLVTEWLEPWAVDRNYNVIQGLRPAGFFANSTGLSTFGVVALCFFYSRYVAHGERRDLLRSLLSGLVIVMSTSRTAYAAGALVLFAGWWLLPPRRKAVTAVLVLVATVAVLVTVERTVGVEEAFHRFQRIAESGLLEDRSLGQRVNESWPAAIEAARDFRLGTLVQAQRAVSLIDSGYLNYYLQGRWLFVAAVAAMLAGLWFLGLRAFFGPPSRRLGVVALFLAIYLTGALIVSNPLRSPLVITFLVYVLWRLQAERGVKAFAARRTTAAGPAAVAQAGA